MKFLHYKEYLVSTGDTYGLHQGISSYNAEYTTMHFQLFIYGLTNDKLHFHGLNIPHSILATEDPVN